MDVGCMAFFPSHVENASLVLKVCAPLHSKLVLVHLLFIYYSVSHVEGMWLLQCMFVFL